MNAHTSTAPAATSFATLARGSKLVVATSIAASIAVLSSSATITRPAAISSASSSTRETPTARPAISTSAAAAKWIRMLRCVRSA